MKKNILVLLAVSLFIFGMAGRVYATVLDFEGLTTEDYTSLYGAIGSINYEGFAWGSKFYIVNDNYYSATYGNTYGSTSGSYAAYNGGGISSLWVFGSQLFDFTGANFSGWAVYDNYYDDNVWATATFITINGYNSSGALAGSVSLDLSANQYDWLQADLKNISKLEFVSSASGAYWLMDDFTFNESSPIPEPGTIILLVTALAGLCVVKNRGKMRNESKVIGMLINNEVK